MAPQLFEMALQIFQTIFRYLVPVNEQARADALRTAQSKAVTLFEEIEATIVRPGISEEDMSREIQQLASDRYGLNGLKSKWHKNIVRSGPNTLKPYKMDLTDRVIQEDDILFIDLGPVFQEWEADFGRTFVLGNDPYKLKLRDDLEPIWQTVKARYRERPDMTGGDLYRIVVEEVEKAGWQPGREHAGHNIADLPHEQIPRDKITFFIHPENNLSMVRKDKKGCNVHWILEIHMTDGDKIGGFFEQLLTVD